ncbi:ATP synthase F0 subunit B [uncultured Desulfosarcina sp.]|uniref:ATP synthase F0 subunit B n=1 Tax=uncultured Desulfosarcina sp. TaxID=218289 RepID=UPI0029C861EE|nr:ATP synthase F0 subunit B [uncultured Desulfosarcina sp.]
MEIIATNALISINATFAIQLISFLIFLYIMNRIMFRPLRSTMEQRDDYIDRVKEDIRSGKEKLDQLAEELDEQRARVVKEADKMAKSLESEGDRQAAELIEQARKQIVALRSETESRVVDQVKQARKAIAEEVETVTVAVMEKVLHRRLSS